MQEKKSVSFEWPLAINEQLESRMEASLKGKNLPSGGGRGVVCAGGGEKLQGAPNKDGRTWSTRLFVGVDGRL